MRAKSSFFVLCILIFLFTTSLFTPAQEPPSSKTLSLDLKGLDILDIFKIISQTSGLNIIANKNVTGKVTLFLKDIDAWDAFLILVESNNLAYERQGNNVKVMTDADFERIYGRKFVDKRKTSINTLRYAKANNIAGSLNQIKTNIGRVIVDETSNTVILLDTPEAIAQMEDVLKKLDLPTETKTFVLNYAKAKDLGPKIEESITKAIGSVKVDERTNSIIVTELKDRMSAIENIVMSFDRKDLQVFIESKIMQVILSDEHSLGIDWDVLMSGVDGKVSGKFDIIPSGSLGGSFTIGSLTDKGYTALVEALKTIGKTESLSNPRIAVLNNQEAKILVGTKEVFVTTTVTQTSTAATTAEAVTFIDVGVNLTVTPTINPAGFITMRIKPEISSVDREITTSQKNTIPVVRTSQAETSITIEDGTTIIIAGLIEDKKTDTINKLPLLGNMPILGGLFKAEKEKLEKKELAIFLTPHILSGEAQLKNSNMDEYFKTLRKRIQEFSRKNYPADSNAKGNVKLLFTLLKDGTLKGEPEAIMWSDESLKEYAIKAVKDAFPFTSFPDDLDKSEEMFQIEVVFE